MWVRRRRSLPGRRASGNIFARDIWVKSHFGNALKSRRISILQVRWYYCIWRKHFIGLSCEEAIESTGRQTLHAGHSRCSHGVELRSLFLLSNAPFCINSNTYICVDCEIDFTTSTLYNNHHHWLLNIVLKL